MSIVLAGYRGSGKTTVGRMLAEKLSQKFVDCDDLIIRKAGKSIREIFAKQGEDAFRDLETEALGNIAKLVNHVIAVGGGALQRPVNRMLLADAGHKVIYLRCDSRELLRRIQADPLTSDNRPSLTSLGGGLAEIEALLSQREPIYRSTMVAEIDVTQLSPEEAAARIMAII